MTEVPEETQKDIVEFQNIQRQMQVIASQRQRFDVELAQIGTALTELEKNPGKAYKAIGTLLIESKAPEIKKELHERKETFSTRIETLKKQEDKLRKRADELQKKLETALAKAK